MPASFPAELRRRAIELVRLVSMTRCAASIRNPSVNFLRVTPVVTSFQSALGSAFWVSTLSGDPQMNPSALGALTDVTSRIS